MDLGWCWEASTSHPDADGGGALRIAGARVPDHGARRCQRHSRLSPGPARREAQPRRAPRTPARSASLRRPRGCRPGGCWNRCRRGRVPARVPDGTPRGTAARREWPLRDAHVRFAARVHPRRAQHRVLLHGRGAPLHLWRPVAGMNFIDRLRAPLFVSWQLTRDCDLCCLHCCTESAPGKKLGDELDAREAMRVADEIVASGVPYVMLCGGEPLVVPYFFDLAERLGRAGVHLKIETNGQRFDAAVAERLARLP